MTMTEKWDARMKKDGVRFAAIRTTKAIFDRVAIVKSRVRELIIQYPWGKPTRNAIIVPIDSIKQERIDRAEIESIDYYLD